MLRSSVASLVIWFHTFRRPDASWHSNSLERRPSCFSPFSLNWNYDVTLSSRTRSYPTLLFHVAGRWKFLKIVWRKNSFGDDTAIVNETFRIHFSSFSLNILYSSPFYTTRRNWPLFVSYRNQQFYYELIESQYQHWIYDPQTVLICPAVQVRSKILAIFGPGQSAIEAVDSDNLPPMNE